MKLNIISRTAINDYKTAKLIVESEQPRILTLNDWHYGALNCDLQRIKKLIKYIEETDNCYAVMLGDLIENSNKHSVADGVYNQTCSPDDQLVDIIELLKPIKHKIIGSVTGNHEERTQKDDGVNLTRIISSALDVEYFGHELMLSIVRESGNHTKAASFYFNHTKIGGKNAMTIMNTIDRDVASKMMFDIYVKAHDHHACVSPPIQYMMFNKRTSKIDLHSRYIVLTGSFLHRANSYATKRPYAPTLVGTVEMLPDMTFGKPFKLNHNILTF